MHVVAVADLHGRFPDIPQCDVLLVAGDICPDIEMRYGGGDPSLCQMNQYRWCLDEFRAWEQSVPAERILCTPGNHDWIQRFPEGCRSEMFIDELVEWRAKTFWFTPWVAPCGAWNYQMHRDQRKVRFADIPYRLDVLVSHSPARNVGDLAYGDVPSGCHELRAQVQKKQPRHHIFGHIHEGQRYGRTYRLGGTKVFHASMWGPNWSPVEFDI